MISVSLLTHRVLCCVVSCRVVSCRVVLCRVEYCFVASHACVPLFIRVMYIAVLYCDCDCNYCISSCCDMYPSDCEITTLLGYIIDGN